MARDETIKLSLIDGVTKSLTAIQKGVGGVGAELAKLNQVAELAGKGFAALGNIAGGIGDAVAGVADLETALARVVDITQATTEEQVALQQAVRDAATEVGVTAEQAAGALVLMAEDGFSASEAVSSLSTVLSFAKANAQDAATATQALGGVLDTFGEKPAIIAQLADQLTAAARAAGTGTTTLQNGLAAIGVQAEQAGLGVSSAVAALAALASRGIEGTQAAKQLGIILTQLNDPASKAGKALDEAGLAGKSFGEIVDVLSKDSAKAATVLEALGNKPRAALKVLLADGGGALKEFGAIVDGAAGSSERAAAVIDETFNGAVARLQAAVGNLRNEFLAPILQPLADEVGKVAAQINSLSESPQFARVREQFAAMATGAIQSVGNLIANADLEQWAGEIANFAEDAKTAFEALVVVVQATADTIRAIGSAVEYVREVTATLDAAFAEATGATNRLNVAARETGKAIEGLGAGLDKNKKATREHAAATDAATTSTKLFASASGQAGAAAASTADQLGEIPKAAKLVEISMDDLSGSAEQTAIGLERFRLATLVAAQTTLYNANLSNSDSFRALTVEIGKTEANIAALQEKIDKTAKAQDDLSDKTDKASNSLRGQASAARDAADATDRVGESSDRASESTGNFGKNAKAAQVSLGNYSQELINLGLQMQKQAFSAKAIIDVWANIKRAYDQANTSVERAIDVMKKQNTELSEEQKIREQVIAQYGNYTTRIEELIRLKLEQARANRAANDEAEREIQIVERRQAQIAGGIGITRGTQATDQTAPTTGGRGNVAGGGRSGEAPQINITVQGMTTDQAREFVAQAVVPELARLDRLSR